MSTNAIVSPNQAAQDAAQRRLFIRLMLIGLCALLLVGSFILALSSGSQSIPASDIIKTLQERESVKKSTEIIIHEVRLPRALVGLLVGLNLAVSGTMLQGVVRSPLGDPYILGVSAGGALFAAITSLEPTSPMFTDTFWPDSGFPANGVPVAAFVGSLIGALLVYAIAWDGSGVTTTRLALAGVALTAMISAFTTTIVVMNVEGGGQIFFQVLVGGLYTAGWQEYNLLIPYSIIGVIAAMGLATRANVLALGDEMAQGLGLNVELTRFLMSAVAAILAGSAVAAAGLIAFVGLLIPFIARRLVGSDFRLLIPASALLGGALMMIADTVSRVTLPILLNLENVEFPVGIVTAVVGGPLFLWLVRARRAQW